MKKYILPLFVLAAGFSLVSCDEDYTDWAQPQSHEQESTVPLRTLTIAAGADANTVALNAPDTLHLLEVTAPDRFAATKLTVNDVSVPFTVSEKNILVTKAQLDSVVRIAFFTQVSAQRTLNLQLSGAAIDQAGQAVVATSNVQTATYTNLAIALPTQESAYYLVGSMNGWSIGSPTAMTANGDGTFSATFTVGDDCYYKIFGQAGITASDWNAGMGQAVSQYPESKGFIYWTAALGQQPEALYIKEAGTYKVTFDAVNWTYKYEKQ